MRTKVAVWVSVVVLGVTPLSRACLWLHGTTIEGAIAQFNGSGPGGVRYLTNAIDSDPGDELRLFENHEYHPEDPVASANDAAVEELVRGHAVEAVKMLKKVESDHPGVYFTAANLGTAYELAGDNESALQWIQQGMKRNPDSHMRTEWLHARILETKIKLATDPAWLATHTITGADFTRLKDGSYFLDTLQGHMFGHDILYSLHHQLFVRMLFVKPKDPVVAELLKELAQCEGRLGYLERAEGFAKLAFRYGLPPGDLDQTLAKWQGVVERAKTIRKLETGGMALIVVAVLFWLQRWSVRRRAARIARRALVAE